MALITCPECGRDISDQAVSCPGCGYVLQKSEPVPQSQPQPQWPTARKTLLSEKQTSPVLGVLSFLFGLACFFPVFLLFITGVGIVVAIPLFILSCAAIHYGIKSISGVQDGACPYCGNNVTVPANASTFTCPHCHKISTRSGDALKTI